jgi:hypothetical protein
MLEDRERLLIPFQTPLAKAIAVEAAEIRSVVDQSPRPEVLETGR